MNKRNALSLSLLCSGLLAGGLASAQEPPRPPSAPTAPTAPETPRPVARAEAAERQARALEAAEAEQRAALEAVEGARRELALRAEEVRRSAEEVHQRRAERRALEAERTHEEAEAQRRVMEEAAEVEREELRNIQRELERAHENLRQASREVARVHREIERGERRFLSAPRVAGNRAVIGVILGDSTEEGVRVIGISPDGPAERAGLRQGDVIVSLMGEPLAAGQDDAREVLTDAMAAIEPGDELAIVIERDGERLERAVTAEERTPFSWHSVTRLRAPGAPDAPVVIQEFDMPVIDTEHLERELERMQEQLKEHRIVIETQGEELEEAFVYEIETLSDIGDAAIAGTNIWFGMPLTRGLKFAELDQGLADYFGTDRGVLVLKARDDNVLALRSGDVILFVGDTEVRRPADVMRALRGFDAGASVELRIMRRQANETLVVDIPENRLGLHFRANAPIVSGWRFELDPNPEDAGEHALAPHPAPESD